MSSITVAVTLVTTRAGHFFAVIGSSLIASSNTLLTRAQPQYTHEAEMKKN